MGEYPKQPAPRERTGLVASGASSGAEVSFLSATHILNTIHDTSRGRSCCGVMRGAVRWVRVAWAIQALAFRFDARKAIAHAICTKTPGPKRMAAAGAVPGSYQTAGNLPCSAHIRAHGPTAVIANAADGGVYGVATRAYRGSRTRDQHSLPQSARQGPRQGGQASGALCLWWEGSAGQPDRPRLLPAGCFFRWSAQPRSHADASKLGTG